MIQRNHAGDKPRIASTACVHPSAVVIGNVEIGEKVVAGLMVSNGIFANDPYKRRVNDGTSRQWIWQLRSALRSSV